MDYEKKYKALVEAVNMLKETNPSDEGIQNWVKDNVPELQESEDERIRKCITDLVKENDWSNIYGIAKEQCIAWLERQGKQDMTEAFRTEYEKGRADAIAEMQIRQMQEYLDGVDRVQNYKELTKFEKGFDRIADTYAHRKNKDGYNKPWYTKERAAEMLYWAKEELGSR